MSRQMRAAIAVGLGAVGGAGAAAVLVLALDVDVEGRYDWFRSWLLSKAGAPLGTGIFRPHPTRGEGTIPGGSTRHGTREFDVVYSIDETGARRVPGNDYRQPIVEFLGDSFTFGHGVSDSETFGARVRLDYWPKVAIRNRAILGWSMVPNALILDEDLDGEFPPSVIVYGWLYAHNERAFHFLRGSGAPFPKWLADLKRELVDPAQSSGAEQWREIGHRVILRMAQRARERELPFWVVILAMPGWGPHEREISPLVEMLEREGIRYIDLQHHPDFASRKGLQYPIDHHPTPEYHRRVARILSEVIPEPR